MTSWVFKKMNQKINQISPAKAIVHQIAGFLKENGMSANSAVTKETSSRRGQRYYQVEFAAPATGKHRLTGADVATVLKGADQVYGPTFIRVKFELESFPALGKAKVYGNLQDALDALEALRSGDYNLDGIPTRQAPSRRRPSPSEAVFGK